MSATTLVAIRTDTDERVTIGDVSLDTLRTLSDSRLLVCVHCGSPLMLKAGAVRLHHFAHVNLAECGDADHEPESESHLQGKWMLYQQFRANSVSAALEQHLPATDQRADVFIQMSDSAYALEFQQANNTVDHWLERHDLYQGQHIHDIWFLGQIRYRESQANPPRPISPYDPLPVPHDIFKASSGDFHIRELEKAILSVEPMLRFLDPDSGELTVLLARDVPHGIPTKNVFRAYRYQMPLADCELRQGSLWTPLDPFLSDYRRYIAERNP